MATNQRMMRWLRRHETLRYTGTDDFVEFRLIDFYDPRSSKLVDAESRRRAP